jgi:hypothetical protein
MLKPSVAATVTKMPTTALTQLQIDKMIADAQAEAQRVVARQEQEKRLQKQLLRYRYDPVSYIQDKLEWTPWAGDGEHPGQVELLDSYALALRQLHERYDLEQGKITEASLKYWKPGQVIQNRFRVESGHGIGKCVAGSEWLTLADGRRVQARDMIGQIFKLKTLVNGEILTVDARAEFNATEPVYALITETGKRIIRNAHHPLWGAIGKFSDGRRVKVSEEGWTPLTAFEPGDLVAVAEKTPEPDTHSVMTDEEVKMLAYLIGDGGLTNGSARFSQQDNAQLAEFRSCAEAMDCTVRYVGQYDYYVAKTDKSSRARNPVISLCSEHGIMGKGAREKRVPPSIFGLPNSQLRIFLSRLYSTDGWASVRKRNSAEIGFGSSSLELILDVQELLLRFGIHSRIFHKPQTTSWTLGIHDSSEVMRFVNQIGIYGKEAAVEMVRARCTPLIERRNRNLVQRPDRPGWRYTNAILGTRWERVVSVEQVGIEDTVAIEVPEGNTFLTTFFEHNTKCAAGIVSHFFDTCAPSIIYTFAPTFPQINDLLWKEIRADREGRRLPGKILQSPELKNRANHFAKGRATDNAHGNGTESIQGQHGKYLMFVMDEAEGVADYVFNAIEAMTTGGIVIVLMLANPRTRTSTFYKQRVRDDVVNFRISCIWHPNVIYNKELVPGAVKREYVENMLKNHCEVVEAHIPDDLTFEVPWHPGVIYRPDSEFLFRVSGIPPLNSSTDTFIPVGRYEAAVKRKPEEAIGDRLKARLGADVARYGDDMGALYILHNGRVWREKQFAKQDTNAYVGAIMDAAKKMHASGVRSFHLRIDAGGGFSSGVVDNLKGSPEMKAMFSDYKVIEIDFGGKPHDEKAYADCAAEMYASAADALQAIKVIRPPELLESDLTERTYKWVSRRGVAVKQLEPKDNFRKRLSRSPDDGDAFVMTIAPDHIFRPKKRAGTW